jgi:hypothetical protein
MSLFLCVEAIFGSNTPVGLSQVTWTYCLYMSFLIVPFISCLFDSRCTRAPTKYLKGGRWSIEIPIDWRRLEISENKQL